MIEKMKSGTKCWYRNTLFGRVAATVVDYHPNIKNGVPGYDVLLDSPQDGETQFWGYVDQVTPREGGAR